MVWFTSTIDITKEGWRFDAVSLLAVIGESIIERQKHVITASPFSTIPRLLPAPQAIVTSNQLTKLPVFEKVRVHGVYSGFSSTELNYFAGVIHEIDQLKPFEVRVYHMRHVTSKKNDDLEGIASHTLRIRLKPFCAINILTIFSVFVSIGLSIWAILIEDGIALVSIITMSLSSSLACLSQRSYPEIPIRPTYDRHQPPGDIVICTQNGAYVVVHCTEDVARSLYTIRETYSYVFGPYSTVTKMLLGSSTKLLMASVLLFSNCGWIMQTAIAATYIVLNLFYWATSVLFDGRRFWDLSSVYDVNREEPRCVQSSQQYDFTSTLWSVIFETGQIRWVENAHLIPGTKNWQAWLLEAMANITNREWDPLAAKDRWMAARFEPDNSEDDK